MSNIGESKKKGDKLTRNFAYDTAISGYQEVKIR